MYVGVCDTYLRRTLEWDGCPMYDTDHVPDESQRFVSTPLCQLPLLWNRLPSSSPPLPRPLLLLLFFSLTGLVGLSCALLLGTLPIASLPYPMPGHLMQWRHQEAPDDFLVRSTSTRVASQTSPAQAISERALRSHGTAREEGGLLGHACPAIVAQASSETCRPFTLRGKIVQPYLGRPLEAHRSRCSALHPILAGQGSHGPAGRGGT